MSPKSVQQNFSVEIDKIKKGLTRIQREGMKIVAEELSKLGESILYDSNERCPYDTGKLRNKGRAYLYRGARGERVAWVVGADTSGGGTVKVGGTAGLSAAHMWRLEVYYKRFAKDGFDVAFFTHQNMEYKPQHTGTGPKYLENAYIKNIAGFERRVEAMLNMKLKTRYE